MQKKKKIYENVKKWLTEKAKLPQYVDLFINWGYNINEIMNIEDSELIQIGIERKDHREQILNTIKDIIKKKKKKKKEKEMKQKK